MPHGGGARRPRRANARRANAAALLLLLSCAPANAGEREPDITVTADRVDKWAMSFDDMEYVTRVIQCGKALYRKDPRRAWPYLHMGARYGDKDSQFLASIMLGTGEDVPRDTAAAVGWLGVAAEGNIKPMAQSRLREVRDALCGTAECGHRFDGIVDDYRRRYGRRATGMACRYVKGEPGWSRYLKSRGSRAVDCRFARLLHLRGLLDDAALQESMGAAGPSPATAPGAPSSAPGTAIGQRTAAGPRPQLTDFTIRPTDAHGGLGRRVRCPDLGGG